tara:strand:- start:697 stop:1533 length:837 start_codon:yes stop_codon:yes gene_type:complete
MNYGIGVDATSFNFGALRGKGSAMTGDTLADAAADNADLDGGGTGPGMVSLFNTGKSKTMATVKAFTSYNMTKQLSLEAGVFLSTGKVELVEQFSNFNVGEIGTTDTLNHTQSNVTMTVKPTYGFTLKGLFGTDAFKIGPEVRIQNKEVSFKGEMGAAVTQHEVGANSGANTDVNITGPISKAATTVGALDTKKSDSTDIGIGLSMSGKLTSNIIASAGFTRATTNKNTIKFASANTSEILTTVLANDNKGTTALSEAKFEKNDPNIDTYYFGLSYVM